MGDSSETIQICRLPPWFNRRASLWRDSEITMTESIAPDEAVDLYLKDRKPEVTKSTYRNHKYHVKRFLEWCEDLDR